MNKPTLLLLVSLLCGCTTTEYVYVYKKEQILIPDNLFVEIETPTKHGEWTAKDMQSELGPYIYKHKESIRMANERIKNIKEQIEIFNTSSKEEKK